MRRLFLLAAVVSLSFSFPAWGSDGVIWYTLEKGTEKAKIEKKPMIVDFFFGEGCPRCEALEKGVYGNASIAAKINADFIPIRIDMKKELSDAEKRLGERFDYKKDCMLLFLDPEGNIVRDPLGKRLCFTENVEPKSFIRYLDDVKRRMRE